MEEELLEQMLKNQLALLECMRVLVGPDHAASEAVDKALEKTLALLERLGQEQRLRHK